jgi:hypothetical protein
VAVALLDTDIAPPVVVPATPCVVAVAVLTCVSNPETVRGTSPVDSVMQYVRVVKGVRVTAEIPKGLSFGSKQ